MIHESCFVLTRLCRHRRGHVRRHVSHSLKPRHRGTKTTIQSRARYQSSPPSILRADGSCPMSSGDEVSLDPARSPPSQLQSFQYQPEVRRVAGTESVLVVGPRERPVEIARLINEPEDPVLEGNYRDICLSRNSKCYSLVLFLVICNIRCTYCTGETKHSTCMW